MNRLVLTNGDNSVIIRCLSSDKWLSIRFEHASSSDVMETILIPSPAGTDSTSVGRWAMRAVSDRSAIGRWCLQCGVPEDRRRTIFMFVDFFLGQWVEKVTL